MLKYDHSFRLKEQLDLTSTITTLRQHNLCRCCVNPWIMLTFRFDFEKPYGLQEQSASKNKTLHNNSPVAPPRVTLKNEFSSDESMSRSRDWHWIPDESILDSVAQRYLELSSSWWCPCPWGWGTQKHGSQLPLSVGTDGIPRRSRLYCLGQGVLYCTCINVSFAAFKVKFGQMILICFHYHFIDQSTNGYI